MYSVAFDAADSDVSYGTLTVATAGKTSIVITFANLTATSMDATTTSSVFFHYDTISNLRITSQDPLGTTRRGEIATSPFAAAINAAMFTAATANSWSSPSSLVMGFNTSTGIYTFSYTTTFSLTWTVAAGRALCGFSANQSGASSYTGTVVPTFTLLPTLDAVCLNTPNYEPDSIATHVVADDGGGFGTERYVSPIYRDWVQQFEVKAKTMRASAASTHPYTFQHLIEHARGRWPFIVLRGFGSDTALDEVFSLRTESTSWKPDRASFMDDAQFHIPFKTVVEGTLARV
jgi:hypothetical protein